MMAKNVEITDGKIIYTNKKESYIFCYAFQALISMSKEKASLLFKRLTLKCITYIKNNKFSGLESILIYTS